MEAQAFLNGSARSFEYLPLDTRRAIVVKNEIPSTQTGAGSVEGIFGVT